MAAQVLTAHVPVDLAEKVDELAARLDRPRGWIVEQALTDWVELQEERFRLTNLALSDVDDRRVVDHARLKAWVDSLDSNDPLPAPKP